MFELNEAELNKSELNKSEPTQIKSEVKQSNRKQNANYLFKYLLICNFLQYLEAGAVPALLIELENTFGMTSGQQVRIHSLSHSLTSSLTRSRMHLLIYSLTHLLTYSLTHSFTHSLTYLLTYLLILSHLRGCLEVSCICLCLSVDHLPGISCAITIIN